MSDPIPTAKRMSFNGASVKKANRKLSAGNKQGDLFIEHSQGTMVMRLNITHLNQDFLFSLGNLDMVDVEVTIRKVGAREISQPHLPRKN